MFKFVRQYLWVRKGVCRNQAFIDAQNLYLGTTKSRLKWKVDLVRFRVYLHDKYKVGKAYYFIGTYERKHQDLYDKIKEAGFELVFREYDPQQIGKKKGNVDTDVVFLIMKKIAEYERLDKIILVSGDGDYFRIVKYLIERDKLGKILAPARRGFSSLYSRRLNSNWYVFWIKRRFGGRSKRDSHEKTRI